MVMARRRSLGLDHHLAYVSSVKVDTVLESTRSDHPSEGGRT